MSNTDGLIGKDITKETAAALSLCKTAGLTDNIRSFANEVKRLYGCYIPSTSAIGTFYVFDCYMRKWSKWSNTPIDMTVKKTGELVTLEQLYDELGAPLSQHPRTDGVPYNLATQYESKTVIGVNSDAGVPITSADLYRAVLSNKSSAPLFIDRAGTLIPVTSSAFSGDVEFLSTDYLVIPVPVYLSFGPYTGGSPGSMKQLSKYSIHTENSVHNLNIRFKTDSSSSYTEYRDFNTFANNRTIYQTWIPVEASRGRYFIRDIKHEYPYEFLRVIGQEFESRAYSTKTQKAPR
jgi:hypothetical protein